MLRKKDTDRILMTMLRSQKGTSDLNFTPGKPLQVESSGALVPVALEPPLEKLTPYQTEMLALAVIGKDPGQFDTLVRSGSADCAYEVPGECRFRVNVFQTKQTYSLVLRKLETKILTLDDLGLPAIFKDIAAEKNGLVLVTGSTGSGKSTTLAAVLNEMNETRPIHILTIEDPIEYVHPHKKATFNQRELGSDFDTFHSSLRAALRQAPKVILIGEMRDRETVDIGLAAASTGHLVLSTLHSIDCGQTINRIVGMFDKEEEDQIRGRLNECLRYVINQRLLPRKGGGRVASQEIMGVNLRVKDMVLNGETEQKTFYEVMSVSRNRGWQTHDQAIADLYEQDKVTEETAVAYCSNRPVLSRMIDRMKQERGIKDEDALELTLDNSAAELGKLIKRIWPGSGDEFPVRHEVQSQGSWVIYEPRAEGSGSQVDLVFPIKLLGELKGLPVNNPKGEVIASGTTSGGNEPLVDYKLSALKEITLGGADMTAALKDLLPPFFPPAFKLANIKFTEGKKRALQEIAENGKFQHVNALEAIASKAVDQNEIAAIENVIKTIKERGV
ncbi:type IV pilus twitching motility protein PilT [Acanthopleuribacter pedis]|uniref:PilT/PilU family type 4a pilus ATPase n=1 Tax=Acanthopleuribacter pedis TaxID=442870 RepID=A0A8J7QJJ3_9BACT|nr:PilT/PilU family type 4a pilus ATPase [Acanthopleuribacter pedis]MBO1322031.1 PilT/PilU family type 4a pilus ATPase [Acanthopleuribacter pedis]